MKVTSYILAAFLVSLPAAKASITFNATFDPSLTVAEQAAIQSALNFIAANISSPHNITDKIYFTAMSGGLGESTTSVYSVSYDDYYNAFKSVATSPAQLAALASLGTAPASESAGNPVNGNTQIDITAAEGRNLGFATPGAVTVGAVTNYDSEISLNTSITSPPNTLGGSTYNLESVAMHEIDETLGIGGPGSTLTGSGSLTGAIGDEDLFRYSAPGVRSYVNTSTTTPLAYFSINGGTTALSYFNQTPGADFADWLSNPKAPGAPVQVQDAFATPGSSPLLDAAELTAFNAIGYQTISPEPSTFALAGLALTLGCAFALKRKAA